MLILYVIYLIIYSYTAREKEVIYGYFFMLYCNELWLTHNNQTNELVMKYSDA